jgi:hypothetical protein
MPGRGFEPLSHHQKNPYRSAGTFNDRFQPSEWCDPRLDPNRIASLRAVVPPMSALALSVWLTAHQSATEAPIFTVMVTSVGSVPVHMPLGFDTARRRLSAWTGISVAAPTWSVGTDDS